MFDASYMIEITGGRIDESGRASARELFEKAAQHDGPVVFHFHGGLVSRQSAIKSAVRDARFYRDLGGAFPIFPIWKTGILEVLPEVIKTIAKERLFQLILDRVIGLADTYVKNERGDRAMSIDARSLPTIDESDLLLSAQSSKGDFSDDFVNTQRFYDLKGNLDSDLDAPENEMKKESLMAMIGGDHELLLEIDAILNGSNLSLEENTRSAVGLTHPDPPKESKADRDFLESFRSEANVRGFSVQTGLAIVKIIARTIKRFIDGKDHGVHATAVEEVLRAVYGSYIGTIGWSTMKQYTEEAIEPGGASLELLDLIKEHLPNKRVMLVGHSAGSIFISNLMKKAKDQQFEIVFLAPAARMKVFVDGVVDNQAQIAKHQGEKLCFRTFTMSDENEKRDVLIRDLPFLGDLKWFYPRSLLYLISGILEGDEVDADIVGLQRSHTLGKLYANQQSVNDGRKFLKDCTVYSVTDGANLQMRTNSLQHGGFGSFQPDANGVPTNTSMLSIADILKNGWSS